MIVSMTGFASRKGYGAGAAWQWELRSVNGKGLDLRLRLPDWIEGLEPLVRAEVARQVHRGNVSISLKLSRDAEGETVRINPAALEAALSALAEVTAAADQRGIVLSSASAVDVLALRGVLEQRVAETEDTLALRDALMADFAVVLRDFLGVRAAEGIALDTVLKAQLDLVTTLTADAAREATERRAAMADALRDAMARVLANADGLDETRIAQELALLSVKADITEEIDRLKAHAEAARSMLAEPGPVGRKLDFLAQEFNREANTLCSKAQAIALTRIGLDLKTVIDQMREQVQNVE